MQGRILTPQILELSGNPTRTCFFIIPEHGKAHVAESWVHVAVDVRPFNRGLCNHEDLCLFDGDTLLATWNPAPKSSFDLGWPVPADKARAVGVAYSQGRLCIRHRDGQPIQPHPACMFNRSENTSQVFLRSANGVSATARVNFFRHVEIQMADALVTRVQSTVPFSIKVVNDAVVGPSEWGGERRPNGADLSCPARIPIGVLYAKVSRMVIEVDQHVGDGDLTFLVYGFGQ